MSFVDYYQILDTPFNSSEDELKKAYRNLSLKYHPDRNKDNPDATSKQQGINEAYYILGNHERRISYDAEFIRYQEFLKRAFDSKKKSQEKAEYKNKEEHAKNQTQNSQSTSEEFEIFDERLKNWMDEAKKHASQVAKQAAADFKGVVKEGANAAFVGCLQMVVVVVVINLIYFIFKGC